MKKSVFSMLLFATIATEVMALPVSPELARQTAERFFHASGGYGQMEVRQPSVVTRGPAAQNQPYYICVPRSGSGFVIVSGDDELPPVVGYSSDAPAVSGALPPQLEAWLAAYSAYVEDVQQGASVPQAASVRSGGEAIGPLLTTTWGQDWPYNALCPSNVFGALYPAGCVATAAAQIMNYHRWPERGTGSVECSGETLDLSTHVYDWGNMRDSYSHYMDADGNYIPLDFTEQQGTAVATLMRDFGYATGMRYTSEGSFARDQDIVETLFENFGYAPTLRHHYRRLYTKSTWEQLIREELSAGRPMVYSGSKGFGEADGHSFVCDGIDADGLLHINWGWNGTYNGYFDMDILQFEGEGTGHDAGGYVIDAAMVTGIRPLEAGDVGRPETLLAMWNVGVSVYRGEALQVTADVCCFSKHGKRLEPYVAWLDDGGDVIQRKKMGIQTSGGVQFLQSGAGVSATMTAWPDLEPGTYGFRVENGVDDGEGNMAYELFDTGETASCEGRVTVLEDGSLQLADASAERYYRMEVVSCTPILTCYAGYGFVEVETCFRNSGNKAFEGDIEMVLVEEDGTEQGDTSSGIVGTGGRMPVFYAGSSQTRRVSITTPEQPGRYQVRFSLDDGEYLPEQTPCYVEVQPLPERPLLELTSPLEWNGMTEFVQSPDVPLDLSAGCRSIPAAGGATLDWDTPLALYALREGDDPSAELRIADMLANSSRASVEAVEESTHLLSVLPAGEYRFYLKYDDGTGLVPAGEAADGYNGCRVRLLPAVEAFPYLTAAPVINGGLPCLQYATVDVELQLSATQDFQGNIKAEDLFFNGNRWVEFLTGDGFPLSLRAGETRTVTLKAQAMLPFEGERSVSLGYTGDQGAGSIGALPDHLGGYQYRTTEGTDDRLKLMLPASFTNQGYLDCGTSGTLKVTIGSADTELRAYAGELVLRAVPQFACADWVEPLQSNPVSVSLLGQEVKEVELPFTCSRQAVPGNYAVRLYFRNANGDYAVLPNDMDYSLNFVVRNLDGVSARHQEAVVVSADGNQLCVCGLDGPTEVAVYAVDGKCIVSRTVADASTCELPLPRGLSGKVVTVLVRQSGRAPLTVKQRVK